MCMYWWKYWGNKIVIRKKFLYDEAAFAYSAKHGHIQVMELLLEHKLSCDYWAFEFAAE